MQDFIGKYQIDKRLCDEILEYRKSRPYMQGRYAKDGDYLIDKNAKDSLDSCFDNSDPIYTTYISELDKCLSKYVKKYSELKRHNLVLIEGTNIQFYPPNGGYKRYHYELCRNEHPFNKRILVFMTYLNDVYIGGQTQFLYQKKSFSARKGKTLIWPADWTHTHRGIVAPFQEKVIATGWIHCL